MTGTFFIMIACLTWALDTLIRYPLLNQGFSTLQIVLFEHLTLVIFTLPCLWRCRHIFRHLKGLEFASLFFIGGIGSAIGTLAFTQAFHFLNPTVVILLQKLQPLVAILAASWLLKERIHRHFFYWSLLIIVGSFLMIWPDITKLNFTNLHYTSETSALLSGYGMALLAVFSWGMATVCGRYLSQKEMPADAIMSGRFLMGLAVLAVFALSQPHQIQAISVTDTGKIVVMAALSGLLGMSLYYHGLKDTPAQLATLAELTFPVFAALINWSLLGIALNNWQIAGGLILIGGNLGLRLHSLSHPHPPQLQSA